MFLKNISLTHFKCHKSLEIDFSTGDAVKNPVRKTTFIEGENGTGKSALLQAIAMLTGGSEALRYLPGFPNDYIQHGHDRAVISATITTAQGEERALSLCLLRDEPLRDALRRAREGLAPMDAALRHTHRSYFVAGFGSGRRVGTAQQYLAPHNPRYAAVQSVFNRDAFLRPVPDWAADLLQHSGPGSMDTLAAAINTFLPPEVRFERIEGGRVFFVTPDGLLPLELLSNGIQQTVAWVGDLLYHVRRTFGDYKNPLAARGLLLIDEIDLHMHPAWQGQLYDFLAAGLPQFQIIATTCAPATAGRAATEERLLLRREAGGTPRLMSLDNMAAGQLQVAA